MKISIRRSSAPFFFCVRIQFFSSSSFQSAVHTNSITHRLSSRSCKAARTVAHSIVKVSNFSGAVVVIATFNFVRFHTTTTYELDEDPSIWYFFLFRSRYRTKEMMHSFKTYALLRLFTCVSQAKGLASKFAYVVYEGLLHGYFIRITSSSEGICFEGLSVESILATPQSASMLISETSL